MLGLQKKKTPICSHLQDDQEKGRNDEDDDGDDDDDDDADDVDSMMQNMTTVASHSDARHLKHVVKTCWVK